jgi:predicted negative regulator of RcsB-dependent stress response
MKDFIKTIIIPSIIGALMVVGYEVYHDYQTDSVPPAVDGYKFGSKQYEKNSLQVEVKTYKTYDELHAAAKKSDKSLKNAQEIAAFSVINPENNRCTIHMIDPAVKYEPEFVGHEFLHCVYGQWHTNNDSRS